MAAPTLAAIPDGDLNSNQQLDGGDAVVMLRIVRGDLAPTADQQTQADIGPLESSDGVVDSGDAVLLLRAISGEDVDGDGLEANSELPLGASPFLFDTDGDTLSDAEEAALGTDPASADTDGDGISDALEVAAGTDPVSADTDGDGYDDGVDSDPLRGIVYRHADRLGSTTLVLSDTGAILGRSVYQPFGKSVSDTVGQPAETSRYGFTGQRFDSATGIYDYNARWYDPEMGQFLQADSILPDLFDPQAHNPYAYVLNDPTNLVDPTGNYTYSALVVVVIPAESWISPYPFEHHDGEMWVRSSKVGGGDGGGGTPGDHDWVPPRQPPGTHPNPIVIPLENGLAFSIDFSPGIETPVVQFQASQSDGAAAQPEIQVPPAPEGISVAENIKELRRISEQNPEAALVYWLNNVRPYGPQDYKRQGQQYEPFGNFNYGATGRALGIPGEVLLRGAGAVQVIKEGVAGQPAGPGSPFGSPPYGDYPRDQRYIRQGIEYFNRNYYGTLP